ncbi:transposase [Sphingomonas sp. KC8]|nr:IS5/IS1182 family transposase [Sphingomonas sp. KC8]ARS29407.1 transposase [Sphingomonas sp. KC8]
MSHKGFFGVGGRSAIKGFQPAPQGATLLGDKGYDSNAIWEAAARKNVWANIPARSNRRQRFVFSGWVYRQRNLVERFFNRIKHFRGIAIRYDKCPENYLAAV